MKKAGVLFLTFLLLQACAEERDSTVLAPEGYGLIQFGVYLSEVEAMLGQSAEPPVSDINCSQVRFAKYPGLLFMVENGKITRADGDASIVNSAGVAIGAELPDVVQANPQVRVMPHKYDPAGHYLILPASGGTSALVFEESGGLITAMRAGLEPAVEYVESCL